MPIPYDDLDPGIRETVRWLADLGFRPTDSGDGSKAGWMEGAMEWPHVAMTVERDALQAEADRLLAACVDRGLADCHIEATYWPGSGHAALLLFPTGMGEIVGAEVAS